MVGRLISEPFISNDCKWPRLAFAGIGWTHWPTIGKISPSFGAIIIPSSHSLEYPSENQ
jgi:hypothetical protein